MITVIAFDVFNTVVDLSSAAREDLKDYADHLKRCKEWWMPLKLPKSWESLPAFPDSAEGLERLRKKFHVVTCSNGPMGMMSRLLKNAGLHFDLIVPLEINKVFKTDKRAYLTVCNILDIRPSEMMMVTANRTFGDIEASLSLGMTAQLIRDPSVDCPKTIIELAEKLGC